MSAKLHCEFCGEETASIASGSTIHCPKCGRAPSESAVTKCLFCGKPMPAAATTCPACKFDATKWAPAPVPEEEPTAAKPTSPILIVMLVIISTLTVGLIVYNLLTSHAK